MANFNNIKHEIDQNVNTNGVQAITGAILNETLKDMIDEVDAKKQDTLVAGQNITIQGNVISATGGGSGETYTAGHGIDISSDNEISVDTQELAGYGIDNTDYQFNVDTDVIQTKLTAGSNIQISNQGVISATDTNTTYSAGSGLNLNGTTFSVDTSSLAGSGLQDDGNGHLEVDPSVVQEKLTAGDGVEIDGNNEISVKAGSGLGFDANGYLINTGGGGGGTTYTAGDGIEIDSSDAINAKLGNGLQLDGSNNIEIDPSVVATQNDLAGKQDTLTEGQGINIDSNNVISVDPSDLAGNGLQVNQSGYLTPDFSVVASQSDLLGKQDTLVAGSNITINGNTISATDTNTTYSAGSGLNLNGTTFSVDTNAIQEKLTAGTGISINGTTISATGGSGATYTAGQGINIDQNNEISVDNNYLDGEYLSLNGGVLRDTTGQPGTVLNIQSPLGGGGGNIIYNVSSNSGADITLGSSGYDQTTIQNDYIRVLNATSGKQLEISSEGLGDGSTYHASLPTLTQNETLAVVSDLAGKQDTLTAGSGISIVNNVISATGGGGGTSFTPGDALELDQNDNLNVLYGPGLTVNGNNELEVDPSSISGFLPLDGGQLQADPLVPATDTVLDIVGPQGVSTITLDSGDNADPNDPQGTATITMSDSIGYIQIKSNGVSDGTFTASWPSLTGDDTIATLSDIPAGLWESGSGSDSIKNIDAASANGDRAFVAGYNAHADGNYSVALGARANASSANAFAIGADAAASQSNAFAIGKDANSSASYAYAIGRGVQATNQSEVGLGVYNKSTTGSTSDDNSKFTIGNGTGNAARSNVLEIKENGDAYLYGVGGFTGANTSAATTLQDVINNGGGGSSYSAGSGIDITNNTISVDTTTIQEKLTAGSNITISGNVISATGGGASYSAGSGIDITNNTISVDNTIATVSDLQGYLPLEGGTLQNSVSEPETRLELVSPVNGDCSVIAYANEIDSETTLSLNSSSVSEREPGLFASSSDLIINSGGKTGLDLFASASYVEDNGTYTLDEFYSSASVYAPDGAGEILLETNSSGLSDPGNETREARIAISDDRGSIELNPTGFSDGTYSLSFPTLSQDETIATLSDIPSASSLAGDGLQDDGNGALEVKLGSGLQFDANGAIETTGGGGGSSYSAGTGIDITNNTISVDNTIATKAELSGYLPLEGGTLQEDPNDSTSTELLIQSPDNYATADLTTVDLDPGNTAESLAKLTLSDYDSSSNPHTAIYGTDGISNGTYKISFPTLSGDDTFALLSDVQGGGGATYTAGTGISISAQNVISNTAPGLWIAGTGTNAVASPGVNASSASGTRSIVLGSGGAHANYSIAGAEGIAHSPYSIALGYNSEAGYNAITGQRSIALGTGVIAVSNDEVGVGIYNKSYNNSSTSIANIFSVGTGGDVLSRHNALEIKKNDDVYVSGVGGFDGTNYSAASTLQTVLSGKQDTLTAGTGITITNNVISATGGGGGGSCLWTNGTGTDSLVAPGTVSSSLSQDPAAGDGAISCGYDTNADGDYAFASGGASSASGDYSFAANNGTASGEYSAAFSGSGAYGMNSFAAGSGSIAGPDYSVALGGGNVVLDEETDPQNPINAQYGVAIGDGSIVNGEYGTAIGGGVASGTGSIALGSSSTADGLYDVAVAGGNSRGNYSFAASSGQTDSQGHYASALSGGYATGEASLASGQDSNSFSYSSIALGLGVNTYDQVDGSDRLDTNAGEVALGRYNFSESGIIFSIGCGYYDTEGDQEVRENSVAIDSDGKIYLKGLGGYTGQGVSGCTDLVSFLNNL